MSDTKKRHHYVPRSYLKHWSISDQNIVCLKISDLTIFKSNVINIGVEKYLYNLKELTDKDLSILSSFPDLKNCEENLKKILNHYDRLYIYYHYAQELYNNPSFIPILHNDNKLQKIKNKVTCNSIEDIHNDSENKGLDIINKIKESNTLDILSEDDKLFEFRVFVFLQYMRTPISKNKLISAFEDTHPSYDTISKHWALITLKYAWYYAWRFELNPILLINTTDIHFITSDQPVIICNEPCGDIYYPISPTHAIMLVNTIINDSIMMVDDLNDVINYNQKIIDFELNYIYSKSESQLDEIKKYYYKHSNSEL